MRSCSLFKQMYSYSKNRYDSQFVGICYIFLQLFGDDIAQIFYPSQPYVTKKNNNNNLKINLIIFLIIFIINQTFNINIFFSPAL